MQIEGQIKEQFASLSGVATPVIASAGQGRFEEAMLFTHRGLSGPSILQVSSYWSPGEEIGIDLFAGAGGLSAGLGKAGYKHLALVERDAGATRTLRQMLQLFSTDLHRSVRLTRVKGDSNP